MWTHLLKNYLMENFIFLCSDQNVSSRLQKFKNKQKQPSTGVLRKRCSENMQQIYRRTPMPKYDFNKVAKQLKLNLVTCCFAILYCNSIYFIALQLHILGTPFLTKTPGWLLLNKARIQMLTVERNI